MITGILSAVGSALAGGGTGLIGSVVQKVVDLKVKKLEIRRDISLRKIDIEELQMEISRDVDIAETEADAEKDVARSTMRTESFKADKATYGDKLWFVDAIRGVMRPSMTIYAIGLMTWLAVEVYQFMDSFSILPHDEVVAMWMIIIDSIIYLATTSFTWWFGTRPDRSTAK